VKPVFCAWLLATGLLAACAAGAPPPPTPTPVPLRGGGSPAVATLWPEMAASFSAGRPALDLSFEALPSSLAVEDVAAGSMDFAFSTDPAAPGHHPKLAYTPIAYDAIAMIAHPGNAPEVLTLVQARDLFTGYVQDWSAYGLSPQQVLLVAGEEGDGARATFDTTVLGDQPLARSALLLPDDDSVVAYVASHPGAIGYASKAALKAGVEAIPIEDLAPGQDGYPLVQAIDLVLPAQPDLIALALREWLLSPAGQKLLSTRFGPLPR